MTSVAALLSAKVTREHRPTSTAPVWAPKPRKRSNRGASARGNVPDRRLTCAAAEWSESKRIAASTPGDPAPKIDPPVGLAHRIWLSSLRPRPGGGGPRGGG